MKNNQRHQQQQHKYIQTLGYEAVSWIYLMKSQKSKPIKILPMWAICEWNAVIFIRGSVIFIIILLRSVKSMNSAYPYKILLYRENK